MTLAVAQHLVLNVKLELFVVDSLLDLVQADHVLEAEALCWLVFDQRLENFAAALLRRSTDRGQLLDVEDLLLNLEAHHAGVGGFRLALRRELHMHCALELAGYGVLDDVDVLDSAKDFADLLNHRQAMSHREVDDLELRVQAGHHFGVGIDYLTLAQRLLHQAR